MMLIRIAQVAVMVALMTPPALAQGLTAPLESDFETAAYQPFFDNVASRLGGTLENGTLVVVSDKTQGSGQLAAYAIAPDTPTAVYVDVKVDLTTPDSDPDGRISGGGLVIRRTDTGPDAGFYVIVLQKRGYSITGWYGSAIVQRLKGSLPAGSGDTVRLAAIETATGIEVYVDGQRVATIADERIKGRQAGLAVFGGGTFVFDNFGLNANSDIGNAAPPAPSPAPAPNP